jgi:GNAT superfamily N-acetyltransferase
MISACYSQEFLAREVERTSYSYSLAWEGEEEDVRDKGDAVIRVLPTRPYGAGAIVQWINIDPLQTDERLEALEHEAGAGGRPVRWTFGDTSSPPNLAQRLEARGLRRIIHWDGLALTDLRTEIPVNPDIQVEPLSEENLAEWAAAREPADPTRRQERIAAAHRFLRNDHRAILSFLGRLDGQIASFAILRIEPNGVAYLRNAATVPAFRNRGVYLTLVAHRLNVAREAGCQVAVVAAQTRSSSPILRKRGFVRVCGFYGYARAEES